MEIGAKLLSVSALATLGVGLVAGLIRGFSGFGGAIFAVPVLSLIYGPPQHVGIVLASGTLGTIQLAPGALPLARWREVLPVVLAALIATPIGTYVLLTNDPDSIRRGIGVFVLAAAFLTLRGWSWRGSRTMGVSSLVGVFCGVVTGLGGIGGSIATLYLISSNQTAAVIRANLIVIIGALSVAGFGYLVAGGGVTASTLVNVAIYMPTYVVSIWIGSRIFRGTSEALYRRVALGLLVAVGIAATIMP